MPQFEDVAVIIPSLNPCEKHIKTVMSVKEEGYEKIVVVNDGSGESYSPIFSALENEYGCVVLRHNVNLGKGRGLKTAFDYCLREMPGITAKP